MYNYDIQKLHDDIKLFASANGWINTLNALEFATKAHGNQKRSDGQEFIVHPLMTAHHSLSLGFNDKQTATMLLHDTIEDCGVTIEELPVDLDVRHSVDLLTFIEPHKNKSMSKEEFDKIMDGLRYNYYKNIRTNEYATIGKLLDRCNNISTMADSFKPARLLKYYKHTNNYIIPLLEFAEKKYPEYKQQLFLIKYHINSVLDTVKVHIDYTISHNTIT